MRISARRRLASALFASAVMCATGALAGAAPKTSVTTYHNDNYRTGWNQSETTLTPSAVSGGTFGLLATQSLDDQVDTQPLVVANQNISGQGTHDVVYVATESNSIYAFDANTAQLLLRVNFGAPVPYTKLPGQCGNNGPNIGINGTPVIDPNTSTMYVITYTLENNKQTFRIHALDLSTLTDKVPSVVVAGSGRLNNKNKFSFPAAQNRQRPGLLLSNGNVYAGFGSFCDIDANVSRGWVFGWQTGTLNPLPADHLNDKLASDQDNFFLTSVWMSGYGLASNTGGDIFFVTGNSDYSGNSYNAKTNISESVVSLSSDLKKVQSYFTPGNEVQLEQEDGDFGSGGVLLLPPQTGKFSNLAAAAGKDGNLYLLNADTLGKTGGYLARTNVGGCWCGPSYFLGSDGVGRIVASGGTNVNSYKVITHAKGNPTLVRDFGSSGVPNGQDPGFFTSISSNGTTANSAVIWAMSRPTDGNPAYIDLYAFDQSGNTLFSGVTGQWPYTGGNSNTVPTVANGKVYVASYQTFAILGLGANHNVKLPPMKVVDTRAVLAPGEHEIHGVVRAMNGNLLKVATRDGNVVTVDTTVAESKFRVAEPVVGHALIARGNADATGIFHANIILHAKDSPALWQLDR